MSLSFAIRNDFRILFITGLKEELQIIYILQVYYSSNDFIAKYMDEINHIISEAENKRSVETLLKNFYSSFSNLRDGDQFYDIIVKRRLNSFELVKELNIVHLYTLQDIY